MGEPVRFRVTVVGEYEATPGGAAYFGATDPQRMAAIDASNGWRALLDAVRRTGAGAIDWTVAPVNSIPAPFTVEDMDWLLKRAQRWHPADSTAQAVAAKLRAHRAVLAGEGGACDRS